MRVARIECHHLRFEYPEEKQFLYSGGRCTARVTTLVRVHTDCGRVGIGSGYSHPGLLDVIIRHHLAPLLEQEPIDDPERLWQLMHGHTLWYGRKGAALTAIGAIDIAIWDLLAQQAGQPLWAYLGGQESQVPAYASALLWNDDLDQLVAEARGHADKGFRRMKMRMGRSERYDVSAVSAVRKAIGPEIDLMVDAGMRHSPAVAQRMGRLLAELGVFWYEEPFAPDRIDRYRELRAQNMTLLAAGENEFGIEGFNELIAGEAVDIVQCDAARAGGITVLAKVAELARDAGLRFAPHTWSDAVAVTANAHVVAAFGGITVEVDQTGNPFIESLLTDGLAVADGHLQLSDRPGLGVELQADALSRFAMPDPAAVPQGRYSDFVFGAGTYTPAGPYEEHLG